MTAVLVLGAGGFVGGAIMRALAASKTFEPVAGLRRPPKGPAAYAHRIVDATDRAAVERAAAGMTFAVNCVLGDARTMVAATTNLCAAASRAKLHGTVEMSSMAVYGAAEGLVDEDAQIRPDTRYGVAKSQCESLVRTWMEQDGGAAVIFRPGIVYGPGDQQWIGRLARLLRAGRLGDLGAAGDGFCNLVHADDVGAAVVATLAAEHGENQTFNLGAPNPPRWNEVLIGLARAIGAVPVRRVTARRLALESAALAPPLQVAKLLAARAGLAAGVLPEPIPPSLLRLFGQQIRLDSRRADRLLGFRRTDETVGLAEAAAWFRQTLPLAHVKAA